MEPLPVVWLVAIPLVASPLSYLVAHARVKEQQGKTARFLSLIALFATWAAFIGPVNEFRENGPQTYHVGSISLCMDGLSLLLISIVLGLGTFVVLFSGSYMSAEANQEKYYAMLIALIGIMNGLGSTGDLFNLWIWFEAMAISTYFLVAFYHEQPLSLEAGVKYLVQSAAGSVLILMGISLVLSQSGTLNIAEIRASVGDQRFLLAAGGLFIIGFGVKTALVPMHTWLPDAHSQAPSGISAMLSGVVIEAGLIAMLRSLSAVANVSHLWGWLLMGFGCLNMFVGNLMAYRQDQVKRLLAYSSLTHVGYMLVGVGIGIYAGGINGAQGGFFHLFNHGIMKGLAFLAAGALLYAIHLAVGSHNPLTIKDLAGGARRYPLAAFTFSLAVLGLGGIPPLSGFMSKWQIIVAGFITLEWPVLVVVIFTALMSVFSLAYYAPLINALYKREPSSAVKNGKKLPVSMTLPLVVLAVVVLVVGLWPNLLSWITVPAGESLLLSFGG